MSIKFRQQALSHLSSPDQLDKMFRVVDVKSWLVLLFCISLLMMALAWGIWGRLSVQVQGSAILVHNDSEVFVVPSPTEGRLARFYVETGETIQKGQTIAKLDQPLLEQSLLSLKLRRDRLLEDWRIHHENHQRLRHLQLNYDRERLKSLRAELALAREAQQVLTKLEQGQQQLYERGGASLMQYMETKQKLVAATQQVFTLEASINQLRTQSIEQERTFLTSSATFDQQFSQLDAEILQAKLNLQQNTQILSPSDAVVVSLIASSGNYLQASAPIAQLSAGSGRYDLLLYVPVGPAKQIEVGAQVKFSPTAYSPNEYGYLTGKVEKISILPITKEKLQNSLGNQQLVDFLLNQGAAMQLRVQLDGETHPEDTYLWTSKRGEQIKLSLGMLGTAKITVKQQRPIELVIPTLKDWLGV